ncbi:MAG: amidohydrolase [Woeseiaceae bacterium]|nr:amidohydrolase [Woeseiaceae bacterium]
MSRHLSSIKFNGIICLLLFVFIGCKSADNPESPLGADMILENGIIYTVNEAQPWAQAIAIKDGKITFVGSNDEVREFIGSNTKILNVDKKMIIPGMQDAHIHPISGGILAAACDLNGLSNIAEYRIAISNYANTNPDLDWITGGGWAMSVFGAGGKPSRKIIDELVSDRPVYLTSTDGHSGWANSLALEMAGITKDTPNPVDGIIDRDPETGELIGSLQEGAMTLMEKIIPPDSLESKLAGLRYSIKMLNGYGITAIQDAIVREPDLKTYQHLEENNELSLRVVASQWWERSEGLEQLKHFNLLRDKYTSRLINPSTIKIMQDGLVENYTAVLVDHYHNVPGPTKGIPMVEPEFLKEVVTAVDAAGFQVHFHALGDGAARQSLDAVEESIYENGQLGNRHHISHLQLIHPDDFSRFAELDVVANFQPLWAYSGDYLTELAAPFVGQERLRWSYAIKTLEDAGAKIAFGSDWSVTSANPFHQIETSITRQSATNVTALENKPVDPEQDVPLFIEESISLEAAIKAFTLNAAFVNKIESITGSLEVGKLADLVILDQNLFEIEPYDISETQALITFFEGQVVHGDLAQL